VKQGYQARREDRLVEAKTHFAEAVDLCRKADTQAMLARSLTGLGQIGRTCMIPVPRSPIMKKQRPFIAR
jgi:hypothetical protein